MKIKRFNDFLNEGMFVDKRGRLRTDSDDPKDFHHSPRTERMLMFIEDFYDAPSTNKAKFDYMLLDEYDLDRQAKSIYTDLAMAIRDGIIPEHEVEDILSELESEKFATA